MTDPALPGTAVRATAADETFPLKALTSRSGVDYLAGLLATLRGRQPLVQCITNAVVTNFTANVLLAVGAAPAMVDIHVEAGVFAPIASALLVNLGTPHAESAAAMVEAAVAAQQAGTPWVLDPVAVGFLPVRTQLAQELLQLAPTIIRGNASEIIALAGAGGGGRGVDATDTADSALDAALQLAHVTGGVVAISGATDIVTDGTRIVRISNGHEYLTRVTGGGCALGAVMAACAALGASPLAAAVAATAIYTVAAELAAQETRGPGSFAVALIDQLFAVTPTVLAQRMVLA